MADPFAILLAMTPVVFVFTRNATGAMKIYWRMSGHTHDIQ